MLLQLFAAQNFGDPEVDHLHYVVAVCILEKHNVGWLDVAMNDAVLVSVFERLTRLARNFDTTFGAQLVGIFEDFSQR